MLGLILIMLAIGSVMSCIIVLSIMVFAGRCSDIEAEYAAVNEQLQLPKWEVISENENGPDPASERMLSVVPNPVDENPKHVKTQKLSVYTT